MPPLFKKILKVGIGIFFIPLTFLVGKLWPWWEKQPLPMKVVTAPMVLPLVGIVFVVSFWYNEL